MPRSVRPTIQLVPARGQRNIDLSTLEPRTDSIAPAQSRAILAAVGLGDGATRSPRTSSPPGRNLRCVLLAFLLLTPLPNRAQSGAIRIPFRTVQSMMLIEAEVNGDPVTLLVDTGSTNTIISARVYRIMYFPLHAVQRNAQSPGLNGESVAVHLDLKLANHRWVGQRVSIMNLDAISHALGAQFDGLLGQDVLRQFRSVRIDYRARVIELEE
jgi:Aspartyl protease